MHWKLTRLNVRKIAAFTFTLALITSSGWFSACERISQIIQPTTSQTESLKREISIGVVLPLTGHLTDAFGKPMAQGFELALKEINTSQLSEARLKFITEDNRSTPEGTVDAFNKLIHQENVSAILGPVTSSALKAVLPIAQENQTVVISPTSAARGLSVMSDFVFRVALTMDVRIPRGIKATYSKLGYQRVATIYDEADLYAIDADTVLREVLADSSVEVLTSETVRTGDTDFSAQLTRIIGLNPDAIFITVFPKELAGIMIQADQLGISVPFISTLLSVSDLQTAGSAAEGAITVANWIGTSAISTNQIFVQNYRATYGIAPNTWAAQSYAAVYILAEAISNAQSTESTTIRNTLANIKDFDTILGKFSFDANGDAVYEPKLLIVNNGEFELFE